MHLSDGRKRLTVGLYSIV